MERHPCSLTIFSVTYMALTSAQAYQPREYIPSQSTGSLL